MMDAAIDQCAEHGLDEVVIGMQTSRLNVLANIAGKPYFADLHRVRVAT